LIGQEKKGLKFEIKFKLESDSAFFYTWSNLDFSKEMLKMVERRFRRNKFCLPLSPRT